MEKNLLTSRREELIMRRRTSGVLVTHCQREANRWQAATSMPSCVNICRNIHLVHSSSSSSSSSSNRSGVGMRSGFVSARAPQLLLGRSLQRSLCSSKNTKNQVDNTSNGNEYTDTDTDKRTTGEDTYVSGEQSQRQQHGDQQKYLWTTAEAVGYATKHHLDDIGKAYGNIEQTLMSKINESNQRRFRAVLFGVIGSIVWVLFVFGSDIKNWLSGQTAGIAKETLENEQLKIQVCLYFPFFLLLRDTFNRQLLLLLILLLIIIIIHWLHSWTLCSNDTCSFLYYLFTFSSRRKN